MSCNGLISDIDIGAIYNIPQIAKINVKAGCHSNVLKEAHIEFTDGVTFMTGHPVVRNYHASSPLRSFAGIGKVAEHKLFILSESHRKKGIAKALSQNEESIYRKNKFNEVQLDAAMDGITVWKKLGYDYANKGDENKLVAMWKVYFSNQFINLDAAQKLGIMSKVKSISDIPTKYLAPSGSLTFGEWIAQRFQKFPLIEMYKRIA